MHATVVGGDKRFDALADRLEKRGMSVDHIAKDALKLSAETGVLKKTDLIISNLTAEVEKNFVNLLSDADLHTEVFFCGPDKWNGTGKNVVDLSQNEGFLRENACLTAEGAVYQMMRTGAGAIGRSKCMVIGFGRIGSALCKILRSLGAEVVVATRDNRHAEAAEALGCNTVDTAQLHTALHDTRFVFSTAPVRVFGELQLSLAPKDIRIMDLSSAPYGVDTDAADEMGICVWRESALPGRYCPDQAAEVIENYIVKNLYGKEKAYEC